MKYIKFLILILMFFINFSDVQSAEERMDFQFELSQFLKIETVSSPVLVANITDSTGNLYS